MTTRLRDRTTGGTTAPALRLRRAPRSGADPEQGAPDQAGVGSGAPSSSASAGRPPQVLPRGCPGRLPPMGGRITGRRWKLATPFRGHSCRRGNRRARGGADHHERPCPCENRGGPPMVVFAMVSVRAVRPAGTPVRHRRRLGRRGQRPVPVPAARGAGPAAGAGRGAGGGADHRPQLPVARVVDVRATPAVSAPVRAVQPHRARSAGGQRLVRLGTRRTGSVLPDRQPGGDRGGPDHQLHDQYDLDMGRTDQWSSSSSER